MANPRISLTRAQIEEGIGAELFSLCEGIAEDGKLSKDEVVALGSWLRDNREHPLPGIELLDRTFQRIIADGRITRDESKELMEAIEKVLPPDARKVAKAARKAVETDRKAREKAAKAESKALKEPEEIFDFMVVGVQHEERHRVTRRLEQGERVRVSREPHNPKDRNAVLVTRADGAVMGYVPKDEAREVSQCLADLGYYTATAKKLLTGGRHIIPVIYLRFWRIDQGDLIGDMDPISCLAPKPWWKVW